MRTIKFRGYNKKNNKWIYGYYLVNRGKHFVVEDGIANPLNTWEDYLVEEETIGQFTGLLDKEGKRIYEKDIMNDPISRNIGVVKWNSALCLFQLSWQNMPTAADLYYMANNGSIVIGNIYDNPELINRKEKQQ